MLIRQAVQLVRLDPVQVTHVRHVAARVREVVANQIPAGRAMVAADLAPAVANTRTHEYITHKIWNCTYNSTVGQRNCRRFVMAREIIVDDNRRAC